MKDGSVLSRTDLTSQTTAETDATNSIVTVRFGRFLTKVDLDPEQKPTFKCAELLLEHLKILM